MQHGETSFDILRSIIYPIIWTLWRVCAPNSHLCEHKPKIASHFPSWESPFALVFVSILTSSEEISIKATPHLTPAHRTWRLNRIQLDLHTYYRRYYRNFVSLYVLLLSSSSAMATVSGQWKPFNRTWARHRTDIRRQRQRHRPPTTIKYFPTNHPDSLAAQQMTKPNETVALLLSVDAR